MPDQIAAPTIATDAEIPYLKPLPVPAGAGDGGLLAQLRVLEASVRNLAGQRDLALGTAAREHAENIDFRHRMAALYRVLWWLTLADRAADEPTVELQRVPWPTIPPDAKPARPPRHRARRRFRRTVKNRIPTRSNH
jgi:hypothetical protein